MTLCFCETIKSGTKKQAAIKCTPQREYYWDCILGVKVKKGISVHAKERQRRERDDGRAKNLKIG